MALIKCKSCGHMISDKAVKCPKCGTIVSGELPLAVSDDEKPKNDYPTKMEVSHKQNNSNDVITKEPKFNEEDGRSNRRLYILSVLLLTAIVGGGYWWYCLSGEDREVLRFVEQFAKAIETSDRKNICLFYPKADQAEAFDFKYHKDSVVVIHLKDNDTIDVKLSSTQSVRIVKDVNNQMQIVSSKGLFSCPTDQLGFALKTGWINSSLDDTEYAERLKENEFVPWIEKKAIADMKSKVKVVQCTVKRGENVGNFGSTSADVYNYEVILENMNNCDIAGDAYIVSVIVKGYDFTWWADEGETKEPFSESCNSLTGKLIPKKGTVTYSWESEEYGGAHGGRVPEGLDCNVIFEPNKEDAISAYESTGKEYSEYLDWKNKR